MRPLALRPSLLVDIPSRREPAGRVGSPVTRSQSLESPRSPTVVSVRSPGFLPGLSPDSAEDAEEWATAAAEAEAPSTAKSAWIPIRVGAHRDRWPSLVDPPTVAAGFEATSDAFHEMLSEFYATSHTEWTKYGAEGAFLPSMVLWVGYYGLYREATILTGVYSRGVKELVCSAVAAANKCLVCRNGHAIMAAANGIRGAAQVVTERREDLLADKRIRDLVRWAGSFRRPKSEEVTNPPKLYPRDAVELLGSILVVVWKNPLMILFVGYLEPIPASVPSTVLRALNRHPRLLRATNKVLALTLRDTSMLQPGQMRRLWDTLPPDAQVDVDAVTLPDDLLWATHQRYIAEAVGFLVVQHERIRERYIHPDVAACVESYVATEYNGKEPRADTPWADKAVCANVRALGGHHVFLTRLLLTVAVAAKQVDATMLRSFRLRFGTNELMLTEVCAWASWVAARRAVAWMARHLEGGLTGLDVPADLLSSPRGKDVPTVGQSVRRWRPPLCEKHLPLSPRRVRLEQRDPFRH